MKEHPDLQVKMILHCEPREALLALRTAKKLIEDDARDCIAVGFENNTAFFAKRNKSGSITVWQDMNGCNFDVEYGGHNE